MSMLGRRGFTLIEILVAMAIAGLVLPALVSSIYQMTRGTTTARLDFIIQQDIDVASTWFNRDLSQALTTDVADGAAPVNSMRVDWIDQSGWAVPGDRRHTTPNIPSQVPTSSGTTMVLPRLWPDALRTSSSRAVAPSSP